MKHEELLEYSTVLQIQKANLAAKDEALRAIIGACERGFEAETVKGLAENALKLQFRNIDFVEVVPE